MTTITEIAPDVYRISIYVPEANLQFNHFVVKDDQPLPVSSTLHRSAGSASAILRWTNAAHLTNGFRWPQPPRPPVV